MNKTVYITNEQIVDPQSGEVLALINTVLDDDAWVRVVENMGYQYLLDNTRTKSVFVIEPDHRESLLLYFPHLEQALDDLESMSWEALR